MTKPIINIKFLADLAQFSSQMQNASREMDKVGRKLQSVGTTLSIGLTAPLTALGVSSVKTFANFEQEMAKVKAISGATGSEFQSLKKNAEDLGAATRFTASQVAALQLNYSKLGFSPDEILNATKATLDLAQATGEDLAQSATVAASTIRGFQLESAEASRVADVMAKSFSSSALDLEKFSTAMAVVAPVANTAHKSIEDTTGMLSVLVNAGIEASTAGTGLRNIFLDIAKSGMSLEEALNQIQTSSNKNATALSLFGKRGATVATVLAENFEQAKAFAVAYRNAGGEAQRMASIMDDTAKGSFARFRSVLEANAIALGEEMAPAVRALTDRASELAAEFKDLSPETKRVIIAIAAFAAATGPSVVVTGTLIRNVNTLIPLFKGLTGAIAANPIGALAVAVGALAGGVLVANSRLRPLTDATKEFAAITEKTTGSIAKEKAQLEQYLSVARNDKISKEERQKAIKKLNALSPKYLGDLSLETINTKQADEATKAYTESLLQKAKMMAAQEKLVDVQKNLLDLQLGQLDAVKPSIWQNLGNAIKSAGQHGAFLSATAETISENFTKEEAELKKLENTLLGFINNNKAFTEGLKETVTVTNALNQALSGKGRKKQEKIDVIANYELVQTGENPLKNFTEELPVYAERLSEEQQLMMQNAQAFSEGLTGIMGDAASGFLENFGTLLAGFATGNAQLSDLGASVLEVVGNIAIQLGKLAIKIGTGILAIKASLKSLNPYVAIAAGVALIALGNLVKGAAANIADSAGRSGAGQIPAFANGGLVMGPTLALVGEYANARSNPEVIAPLSKLQDLIRPDNEVSELLLKGELKARGDELLLVIDRAQQKRKRNT